MQNSRRIVRTLALLVGLAMGLSACVVYEEPHHHYYHEGYWR